MIFFAILFLYFLDFGETVSKLDNNIIGEPYISCERDQIVIELVTERLFTGKVFVKGDYTNPKCVRIFRDGLVTGNGQLFEEKVFMGTVTKSKESFEETKGGTLSEHRPIAEASIQIPRGHSRNNSIEFYEKYVNKEVEESPDDDLWTGIGGASPGSQAAFGGTRVVDMLRKNVNKKKHGKGEEEEEGAENEGIKVFEKTKRISVDPDSSKSSSSHFSTSSPSQCPELTCDPCNCQEKRSRRATNSVRLEVPLNSCNSKRDRKLNPPSVVVSFVAVVSFHDSFITKLDKAYHIQCSYAEAEKTVSTDLDVSMNEETELMTTIEAPTCDYLITDEHGAPVRNGLVGEIVKHSWKCRGGLANKLRMLVHDCFAIDVGGEKFPVIDQNGCTKDRYMLQTPSYSKDGLSAEVEAYIFKFPDRSTVDFQCSIKFCVIDDEECSRIVPPNCELNSPNFLIRKKREDLKRMPTISLHANSLTVFDVDAGFEAKDLKIVSPQSLHSLESFTESFCISVTSFGILVSASTFFATISLTLIFAYIFLRFSQKLTLYQDSMF